MKTLNTLQGMKTKIILTIAVLSIIGTAIDGAAFLLAGIVAIAAVACVNLK